MNTHGPNYCSDHIKGHGTEKKMNELTAKHWIETFNLPVSNPASETFGNIQTEEHAEKYFGWLGRMTNRSYEAWLARGGLQDAAE